MVTRKIYFCDVILFLQGYHLEPPIFFAYGYQTPKRSDQTSSGFCSIMVNPLNNTCHPELFQHPGLFFSNTVKKFGNEPLGSFRANNADWIKMNR
jgi:hypothetical protein